MKATSGEVKKHLETLAEIPRFLARITKGVDGSLLHARSGKDSWSVNDILAHLRACSDVWTYSIYAMLAEHEPALPEIDARKWAKVTGYAEVSFAESFRAYWLQRENLLRVLKGLPFAAWEKSALIFGRKHTIFTQARRMAKHETEHVAQIKSLLK